MLPQSLGVIGGKPNSAHYFIGYVGMCSPVFVKSVVHGTLMHTKFNVVHLRKQSLLFSARKGTHLFRPTHHSACSGAM